MTLIIIMATIEWFVLASKNLMSSSAISCIQRVISRYFYPNRPRLGTHGLDQTPTHQTPIIAVGAVNFGFSGFKRNPCNPRTLYMGSTDPEFCRQIPGIALGYRRSTHRFEFCDWEMHGIAKHLSFLKRLKRGGDSRVMMSDSMCRSLWVNVYKSVSTEAYERWENSPHDDHHKIDSDLLLPQ